ncbi:2-oxo-4-hydroxy-4-carboxy-5-ureidoimidazoline decarboxylase [Hymenobacter sp. BT770]|uniref:2-oxo-4-hydroxy-4-carboxy-5-ureidoimidazoline decarboxylase n=1 Tax=Hymenobacter sp. BT770 TaxID=2886942 RepID=UPI001D109E6B|nr:2-oxo-4-hydroxy-4-carboxy-5-ureidoimidazoline decarboxylase [Hymenobacter sp. BT770]MCC3153842.1 2-oxo-4-hydroxy-4-carboxy-5-ureidoimidazoline decarboxylase [Hymenobacter sp. BT770]MDO3415986.1 2-oxo-4-hydroxy-4-carboxy-5-ureidoimidazoline decarboxylase [Hymenobacter sp. BT770]
MTLEELNQLNKPALTEALHKCCGSTAWVENMVAIFPVADAETLMDQANTQWNKLSEADWREAFTHHPKIGGDVAALREKFASTSTWAEGEQASVKQASQETLEALAAGNTEYEKKFGYIFIVCATGKSAEEMLALLQARLSNKPEDEILIAAGEQNKITRLRLEKLLAA